MTAARPYNLRSQNKAPWFPRFTDPTADEEIWVDEKERVRALRERRPPSQRPLTLRRKDRLLIKDTEEEEECRLPLLMKETEEEPIPEFAIQRFVTEMRLVKRVRKVVEFADRPLVIALGEFLGRYSERTEPQEAPEKRQMMEAIGNLLEFADEPLQQAIVEFMRRKC
jgi:hypothetical protein